MLRNSFSEGEDHRNYAGMLRMGQETGENISQLDRLGWRLPIALRMKTRAKKSISTMLPLTSKTLSTYARRAGKAKEGIEKASSRRLKGQGEDSGLFVNLFSQSKGGGRMKVASLSPLNFNKCTL